MIVNTFKKYNFTADLWSFVQTQDGEAGVVRNYKFDRAVVVHATSSGFGRLMIHFQPTESDVIEFSRLHNLRDAAGVELRPHGVWQMTECEPILNLWGTREGYKGRATLFALDG